LKNQKKLNEVNKPLHPSTNPEILVKIRPLASEIQVFRSRSLKKVKKYRKNIGKIYSPPGKFAERTKLAVNLHQLVTQTRNNLHTGQLLKPA